MKIGTESLMLQKKFGEFECLKLIKDAGFDCVDLTYCFDEDTTPKLNGDYIAHAKKLRDYLKEINLECYQAHAPFRLGFNEEFSMDNIHYSEIVKSLESAAIVGAKYIVVHALVSSLEEKHLSFDRNVEFYKSLIPYCEKYNIKVAIENIFSWDHKRKNFRGELGSPEELTKIINTLNSSCFVACIDVGHAALVGHEPEDFILKMPKGMVKTVHIQDGDYQDDRHMLPSIGYYNWDNIIKALKEIEFDGVFNMEIFKFFQNIPNALIPTALEFAAKVGKYFTNKF